MRNWNWEKIIVWNFFSSREFFFGGGSLTPFFFCENLLVRVKLGHPLNFNFLGKPLLGENYVEGKRKKERRIMPILVATMSASTRTTFVRTHGFSNGESQGFVIALTWLVVWGCSFCTLREWSCASLQLNPTISASGLSICLGSLSLVRLKSGFENLPDCTPQLVGGRRLAKPTIHTGRNTALLSFQALPHR